MWLYNFVHVWVTRSLQHGLSRGMCKAIPGWDDGFGGSVWSSGSIDSESNQYEMKIKIEPVCGPRISTLPSCTKFVSSRHLSTIFDHTWNRWLRKSLQKQTFQKVTYPCIDSVDDGSLPSWCSALFLWFFGLYNVIIRVYKIFIGWCEINLSFFPSMKNSTSSLFYL